VHRPKWNKALLVAKSIVLTKIRREKAKTKRRLQHTAAAKEGAKKATKTGEEKPAKKAGEKAAAKEGAKKATKKVVKVTKDTFKKKDPKAKIAALKARRAALKAAKKAAKEKLAAKKAEKVKEREAKKAKKAGAPKAEGEKKAEGKSTDAKKVGKKKIGKKGKKPFTYNKYGKRILKGAAKYGTRGRLPGIRLHVRGIVMGYRRGRHIQHPSQSLVKIEGVNCRRDAKWYLGKRVAYIYTAERKIKGTHIRVLWGKVCRPHGKRGVVRARFHHNLPTKSAGRTCRIMLYPSRV
jgi:large subunit ribosomal protein L35Ae